MGVVALEEETASRVRVNLVAVSCGVLALGPAVVFVREVLGRVRGEQFRGEPTVVVAGIAQTDRNGPCQELYARMGFQRSEGARGGGEEEGGGGKSKSKGTETHDPPRENVKTVESWVLNAADALPAVNKEVYTVDWL